MKKAEAFLGGVNSSNSHIDALELQSVDAKTPDKWVPRDERLIRLTGAHPLNCESPLTLLFNQGFITPHNLHFVRNHGMVAQATEKECQKWTVSVEGLVENPQKFTINELQKNFEPVTLPVTLCCAGNRRGEQNKYRKSKGFNWGSAGVSTSFWTGALLCDVLSSVKPFKSAKYVIFEGHEDLPNGKYSTGVRIHWAKSFDRGIMLAWKQNGEPLAPDHGRPLRIIIPGVIGGRSVKWLRRIILSDAPPDGWYHKYDNRVIPTNITPEISTQSEIWWTDERYAIYDLNLQSIIVVPEHNSLLLKNSADPTFTLKGFAYNGGGVQVSRIEVSLDAGRSWLQADIEYPEIELRELATQGHLNELYGGKIDLPDRYLTFCWCFWELKVPHSELITAEDIVVRAMDINMVAQPRDMYWSVLGMLGNWWHRVAIKDMGDSVMFQHPTNLKGSDGWMDTMNAAGIDPSKWFESRSKVMAANENGSTTKPKEVKMVKDEVCNITITENELKSKPNWFVVHGHVYDGTKFLNEHPGGPESIEMVSGEDATDDFMAIHSENAKKMLADFHVGKLETVDPAVEGDCVKQNQVGPTFLNPKVWKKSKLLQRMDVSHDTRLFTFALEAPDQTSGLKVGSHVFLRMRDQSNEIVMRAYTPLSCHRTRSVLTLLVKIYFPQDSIPGGKMGALLEKMRPNDEIEIKGPVGSFSYLGKGDITYRQKPDHVNRFLMVGGGSGITPFYQIIKELLYDEFDSTSCKLLYGNRDFRDVMCHDDLIDFERKSNGRVEIKYFLSRSSEKHRPKDFVYTTGRVDHKALNEAFGEDIINYDTALMVCGPPGMVEGVKSWAEMNNVPSHRLVIF